MNTAIQTGIKNENANMPRSVNQVSVPGIISNILWSL